MLLFKVRLEVTLVPFKRMLWEAAGLICMGTIGLEYLLLSLQPLQTLEQISLCTHTCLVGREEGEGLTMGKINPPWSQAVDGDVTQLGASLNCFSNSTPKNCYKS